MAELGASQASLARVALLRLGTVLGLALSFSAAELHPLAHSLPAPQTESTVLVDGHPTGMHIEAERAEDLRSCEVCLLASRSQTTPLRASAVLSRPLSRGSFFPTSPPRGPDGVQRLHPPRGPPLL